MSWYKKSRSSGRILVYHGTDAKFEQFQYQKSVRQILFSKFDVESKGFFFFESPMDATKFGDKVIACYVNLVRPLLDPRRDHYLSVDQLPDEQLQDLRYILQPLVQPDGSFDIGIQKYYIKDDTDWVYNAIGTGGLHWDVLDNDQVVERMRQKGYDGTFVYEPDSYLGRSIFVLSSDQIEIMKWYNEPQLSWGELEDYTFNPKDGILSFQGDNSELVQNKSERLEPI